MRRQIDVFIVADAEGDIGVGTSEEDAREQYNDNIGGDGPRHLVVVTVDVPLPQTLTATVVAPDAAGSVAGTGVVV